MPGTRRKRTTQQADPAELLEGADLYGALEGAPSELVLPSGLCAQFAPGTVRQAVDTTNLTATFVIVTNEQNRYGNSHQITATKLGKGLRTDLGFDSNPVVLFDHALSGNPFPIARSSSVRKTASKAVATAHFPERLKDLYPANLAAADDCMRASAAVFAGVAEGLLTMSSIGFAPIKAMLRKQEAEEELPQGVEKMDAVWRGLHFVETELREWSITAIGADRGALKQALDRGKIHDIRLPVFLRQSLVQIVEETEPEGEPESVAVGIDLSSLEQKIDELASAVEVLGQRLDAPEEPEDDPDEQPEEAPEADGDVPEPESDDTPEGDDGASGEVDAGENAGSGDADVANDPPDGTIPEVEQIQEPDGEALVAAFRQRTAPPAPDLSQLEAALAGVIEQRVNGVAGRVEAVEQELHRRLGRVT